MTFIGDAPVGPSGAVMPFSPAAETSGLVFLSGQLALRDGRIAGDDIGAQTELIFDNIEAILGQAGLGLPAIVKATIWLTRAEDFAAFNAVYAARFGDHRPVRSAVVSQLVLPGALVEVEVIAERG